EEQRLEQLFQRRSVGRSLSGGRRVRINLEQIRDRVTEAARDLLHIKALFLLMDLEEMLDHRRKELTNTIEFFHL
nr:hypothetical protein [Tanacetum cinerariifolium]